MQADESGAPWPYDPVEPKPQDDDATPTWECPDGGCACHPPRGEKDPAKHSVVLFDHEAKRMPGARCRVLENGKLINVATPYAGGDGAVSVELARETRVLEVEWAPADLPETPRYPFRKRYYVDLGQSRRDAVARRLHNIGFSRGMTLRDNILEYQRTYEKPLTGRAQDVEAELVGYHDDAALPPVPQGSGGAGSNRQLVASRLSPDDPPGGDAPRGDGDAKPKGEIDPASDGDPAAKPGASQKGAVTGVTTTKVIIELQMAFSLVPSRFRADEVEWDDIEYDVDGLLKTHYPTPDAMTWRLAGPHGKPVVGAVLTVVGQHASKQPDKTDARGKTTIELIVPAGGDPFIAVKVAPPAGQLNDTQRAAGPALTDGTTTAPFLFRPFTLTLAIDATGALVQEECVVLQDKKLDTSLSGPRDPEYVRIISTTKHEKTGDNLIVVDWRCDWMLSGTEKRTKGRRFDTRDVPINPFDETHGWDDRLQRAPPVVTIHQTGTHHLSFLPGFIQNSFMAMNQETKKMERVNQESIHYVVDIDGFVIKVLDELYRANHAGGSAWDQRVGANDFSIGIETLHTDTTPLAPTTKVFSVTPRRFTREQHEAIIRLLEELTTTYPLLQRRVIGHMETLIVGSSGKADNFVEEKGNPDNVTNGTLSRDRVGCPGPMFEWQRLEERGVALAPKPLPATAPSDPALAATFAELSKLQGVTLIDKKGPEAKLIKQLLFDIGYSVIKAPPQYKDRAEFAAIRAGLSEDLDDATSEAVRAFQTHHFSGRRRKYTIFSKSPPPLAGTIDGPTIDAIQQKWFAAMTEK